MHSNSKDSVESYSETSSLAVVAASEAILKLAESTTKVKSSEDESDKVRASMVVLTKWQDMLDGIETVLTEEHDDAWAVLARLTEERVATREEVKERMEERDCFRSERGQIQDCVEEMKSTRDELEKALTRVQADVERHERNRQV